MENDTIQIDHSARAHATFGPSSLKYYAICGGYHGKDGTSAASEKGTRIHEALEVRNPDTLLDEMRRLCRCQTVSQSRLNRIKLW